MLAKMSGRVFVSGKDKEKYYECHITVVLGDGLGMDGVGVGGMDGAREMELIKTIEGWGGGEWKYSRIDGDGVLGMGVKCYATARYGLQLGIAGVRWRLGGMAQALVDAGFKVIRQKIELVVLDEILIPSSTKSQK